MILVDVSSSRNGLVHVRRPSAHAANANTLTVQSSQHAVNYEISSYMLKSYRIYIQLIQYILYV